MSLNRLNGRHWRGKVRERLAKRDEKTRNQPNTLCSKHLNQQPKRTGLAVNISCLQMLMLRSLLPALFYLTSMNNYTHSNLRNVALVGHASSGKTMLGECMLACSGNINRLGSVIEGTTASDYHKAEQDRQFSIHTSLLHAEWLENRFNIIDTPGYLDFIAESRAALKVADLALIVVHATHGIEIGTSKVWEYAEEFGLA